MLKIASSFSIALFLMGLLVFVSAYASNLLCILADFYAVKVRTTGIGVCYNLAYALASFIPLALTALINQTNHEWVILSFAFLLVLITLLGTGILLRDKRRSNYDYIYSS